MVHVVSLARLHHVVGHLVCKSRDFWKILLGNPLRYFGLHRLGGKVVAQSHAIIKFCWECLSVCVYHLISPLGYNRQHIVPTGFHVLQVFFERIYKMLIFAFDPGKSGAWAAITHQGDFHTCGDFIYHDRGLDTEAVWGELCLARDGQDCQVIVEAVHSMPRDGVRQAFSFGSSYGGVLSLAQRFRSPWHLVPPHQWKKDLGLTSDKQESLIMAREIWPKAPLLRKKDNGRAEALLIALWFKRKFIDGAGKS